MSRRPAQERENLAFTSVSFEMVRSCPAFAALSAGLAVAALARRVAPSDTVDLGPRLGLPPLPSRKVMLYAKAADSRTRQDPRTLGVSFPASAA